MQRRACVHWVIDASTFFWLALGLWQITFDHRARQAPQLGCTALHGIEPVGRTGQIHPRTTAHRVQVFQSRRACHYGDRSHAVGHPGPHSQRHRSATRKACHADAARVDGLLPRQLIDETANEFHAINLKARRMKTARAIVSSLRVVAQARCLEWAASRGVWIGHDQALGVGPVRPPRSTHRVH